MKAIKFKLVGEKELTYALRKMKGEFPRAVARGQYNAAQNVMEEAAGRAPYEHGDLERGAYVAEPSESAQTVAVEMGFGGPAAAYMILQHEILGYQHPGSRSTTDNPARAAQGEAKFFEKAINNHLRAIRDTVAEHVDFFIRTGKLIPKDKRFPTKPPAG